MIKKRKIVIIVVLLSILAISIVMLLNLNKSSNHTGEFKIQKNYGQKKKSVSSPNIQFSGVTSITFDQSTKTSFTELENPKGNPCYFKFIIKLTETGKTIYESDYLEPGKTIHSEKLNGKIKAGVYDGVLEIQTRSLRNPDKSMNGLNTKLSIIVD